MGKSHRDQYVNCSELNRTRQYITTTIKTQDGSTETNKKALTKPMAKTDRNHSDNNSGKYKSYQNRQDEKPNFLANLFKTDS